jgi:hypothetical protein
MPFRSLIALTVFLSLMTVVAWMSIPPFPTPAKIIDMRPSSIVATLDGRPRESSIIDYAENDEFGVSDFLEHLRFRRGELHFYADYIRGRRLKTDIVVRKDGTATLQTFGRGKAAVRWLEKLQGKKMMQVVKQT